MQDCSCIKCVSYEFNNIGYFCNLTSNIRNWSAWLSNFRSLNQNVAISICHSHKFCLLSLQVIHHWSQTLLCASRKGVRWCCDWVHLTRIVSNTGFVIMISFLQICVSFPPPLIYWYTCFTGKQLIYLCVFSKGKGKETNNKIQAVQ